jgi:hypothetical protein
MSSRLRKEGIIDSETCAKLFHKVGFSTVEMHGILAQNLTCVAKTGQ